MAEARIRNVIGLGTEGDGINQHPRAISGEAGEGQLIASPAEVEGRMEQALGGFAVAIEDGVFARREALSIGKVEARAGVKILVSQRKAAQRYRVSGAVANLDPGRGAAALIEATSNSGLARVCALLAGV